MRSNEPCPDPIAKDRKGSNVAVASGQQCAPPDTRIDAKYADAVSEIDELQSVNRRVPFTLRLLQGKLQLPGTAYAAPHQDQSAKSNSYPDDDPNRHDGRQAERQTDKQ